ncbi:MAG: AAA family ATPase [Candidatus Dormibacteria bacterium]
MAKSTDKSPFKPGVGKTPPAFVGRDDEMGKFKAMLDDLKVNPRSLTMMGLRGVGKSVASKEFMKVAKEDRVVAIRREVLASFADQAEFERCILQNVDEALSELSATHRVAQKALKTFNYLAASLQASVQMAMGAPVTVTMGFKPLPEITQTHRPFIDRLYQVMRRVGELAQADDRGVIFIIDEAQMAESKDNPKAGPMAQLIQAVTQNQEDDLPVGLVMVGLPSLAQIIRKATSHSERILKDALTLENLKRPAAIAALEIPANDSGLPFEPGVADMIAQQCEDYPYFLQLYGDAVWRQAADSGKSSIGVEDYEWVGPVVQQNLDDTFFQPRFEDVPRGNARLVFAALGGGEGDAIQVRDVVDRLEAAKSGLSRATIDNTVSKLVEDNYIFRDDRGVVKFTAPGMSRFLVRRHPLAEEVSIQRPPPSELTVPRRRSNEFTRRSGP